MSVLREITGNDHASHKWGGHSILIQYILQNGIEYNNTLITFTWHLNTCVVVSDRKRSSVCLKFKHRVMMLKKV